MNSFDERLKKTAGEDRLSRADRDRKVTENRELSDEDRVAMFRQQFWQSALPDLPKIPGYHVCWLTTNNPRDTIHARMRLGYEPILASDIPGWESTSIKTGEYAGMIGVNEMLAFKLPIALYDQYMMIAHHTMPLDEEQKLQETAEYIREEAQRLGANVAVGDGLQELRKPVATPTFAD